jgi:purine nucleoside permease
MTVRLGKVRVVIRAKMGILEEHVSRFSNRNGNSDARDAKSLKSMAAGNYSAYSPALEAAESVGDKVVREILAHWNEREKQIPHVP